MNGARVPPTSLSTNVETQHIGRWCWINTHTHARAFACTRAVDVFEWGGAAMRRIAPNATSIEHGAHALLMPNVCCVWSIGVCKCVCLGGLRNNCAIAVHFQTCELIACMRYAAALALLLLPSVRTRPSCNLCKTSPVFAAHTTTQHTHTRTHWHTAH